MLALAKLDGDAYASIRDPEPWGRIGIFTDGGHHVVMSLVVSVHGQPRLDREPSTPAFDWPPFSNGRSNL